MPGELSDQDGVPHGRLQLFKYLTAESSADYLAVMRLFTATLLADLSAAEVSTALRDGGADMDAETAEERCRTLVRWGNLIPSVRDARVPTVAAYRNSRARFQVSTLGGRVQREVDEILRAADGAREVARELLGSTVEILDRVLHRVEERPVQDAEALAADVTTVFNNQNLFANSARDFYTYLGSVLTRYDLAGEEYARLKGLLLEYVDLISNDVVRHSPAIVNRLELLQPHLDVLVAALTGLPGLSEADGAPVERLPGRSRADWEELAAWYSGGTGTSGPAQLRAAAEQALGQLITNAKRMLSSSSGTGSSRRADLLRMAAWMAGADTEQAHRVFGAVFGTHPARHLGMGPDEPDPRVAPTTSWWDAPPVTVPVSLRARGDRTARGRTSRVPDPGLDAARLSAQGREEEERQRAAAAELIAAGAMNGARLSLFTHEMLQDCLGDFFATHQIPVVGLPVEMEFPDLGMILLVEYTPGRHTRLWACHVRDSSSLVKDHTIHVLKIAGQRTMGGNE